MKDFLVIVKVYENDHSYRWYHTLQAPSQEEADRLAWDYLCGKNGSYWWPSVTKQLKVEGSIIVLPDGRFITLLDVQPISPEYAKMLTVSYTKGGIATPLLRTIGS